MEKTFNPGFGQFLTLVAIAIVSGGAAYVMEESSRLRTVLIGAGLVFSLTALAWARMLVQEAATNRYVARVSADAYKQQQTNGERGELVKLMESVRGMPPVTQLQILQRMYDGLDGINIPAEGVQTHEPDGWTLAREIPGGLATPEQYQRLAADYFDKTHALPVRYYTEYMDGKGNPIFGRKQFERILVELVRAELAAKDPVSGEVAMNIHGERWLRRYYKPPLPRDEGFTPIRR